MKKVPREIDSKLVSLSSVAEDTVSIPEGPISVHENFQPLQNCDAQYYTTFFNLITPWNVIKSSTTFWNLINYVTSRILAQWLYHVVFILSASTGLVQNRCFINTTWINEWQDYRALRNAWHCPTQSVMLSKICRPIFTFWCGVEEGIEQKSQQATSHPALKYKDDGLHFLQPPLSLATAPFTSGMISTPPLTHH